MKRLIVSVLALLIAAPVAAQPERRSVGLGFSVGMAFPEGGKDTGDIKMEDWEGSFNWGFYVNIPLIYTFHITPSAELYKFKDQNATDICLGFKFIIPAWVLDLYVGFVPGLTTVGEETAAHVGGVAGVSFNLFSNLDLFIQGKYKIMFEGDTNIRVLHMNAGFLYHF